VTPFSDTTSVNEGISTPSSVATDPEDLTASVADLSTHLLGIAMSEPQNPQNPTPPVNPTPVPAFMLKRESRPVALDKFNGDKKKYRHWITLLEYYIASNPALYPTDLDKINAVIYSMNDGTAMNWRTNYIIDQAYKVTTYDQFKSLLDDSFKLENAGAHAQRDLSALRQGKMSAEELVAEFKSKMSEMGISEYIGTTTSVLGGYDVDPATSGAANIVIGMFKRALNDPLRKKLIELETPPRTLPDWFKKSVVLDNHFREMQEEEKLYASPFKQRYTAPPRRANFRFTPRYPSRVEDPNAMDVDAMTVKERDDLMKKGACFYCKQVGHVARNCSKRVMKTPVRSIPVAATSTATITAMTEEEKRTEDAEKAFQEIRAIADALPPGEYAKMMELSKKEGGF